ncbi:MAG: zinc ribbon domain-containing protein [Ruminococcus sp.]|nr:zinc ribbon domain-containing protein [Ruminococcus sp.]
MGFFDQVKDLAGKVGNTVEKGAKSVSDGSKKMAEKSRIKKEISSLENEITSAYVSIGKVYFSRISENPEPECAGAVETIVSKGARIEQLRQILDNLEDKQNCANCGAIISKEQKFCDKCGAKVESVFVAEPEPTNVVEPVADSVNAETVPETEPSATAAIPEDVKICTECGKPAAMSQIFCENCGKKF